MEPNRTFTAFVDSRSMASGEIRQVLTVVKSALDDGESASILIFEDQTGRQTDFDFRGSISDVLARLSSHPLFADDPVSQARTGPGRPKLGVVSREVSLLPRHWEWLELQSSGASGTIRRLVDEARKSTRDESAANAIRDAASKFMWVMAGNLSNFEEASRALFAGDRARLDELMRDWPGDIRDHIKRLLGT